MSGLGFGLGFEWRVALRFLREGRMQSVLIVVGVAAGVAVVAFISTLITGLQGNTIDKTLGAQAHLTLLPPEEIVQPAAALSPGTTALARVQSRAQRPRSMINWTAVVPWLEALPEVTAVSPMMSAAGLALRGEATNSIALAGVELERYERIVRLSEKVIAGQARLGPGDAIVGRELADDLGVQVGDRITLLAAGVNPVQASGTTGTASSGDVVRVTAIVDLGVRELNRRTVLVPLRAAQSLVGLPGGATRLDLTLADLWAADTVADALAQRLPYRAESWQQANAQLVSALNAQTVSTTIIRVVVMLVVVLGIASVLVVSVVQKQREIGILRAMGATRGQVQRVFLLQGLVVGAVGSAAGIVLAAAGVWGFTHFVKGSDGLPLFVLSLPPRLGVAIALLATVCGVLAALAPARRAAALDPAQAIRL